MNGVVQGDPAHGWLSAITIEKTPELGWALDACFGAHSDHSQDASRRRAFRPIEASNAAVAMSAIRRFATLNR